MLHTSVRGVALFGVLAFAIGLTSATSEASIPNAQQGVTKDSIQIVLIVPDIDALRARGVNLPNLSTADFVKRFTTYVDAYGPINERKVVVKTVGWDPIDVTSFDKVCTAATLDNKPFVVVNGSGFRDSAIPCLAVDNHTPFISGDMGNARLFKAAGKNLLTLGLPSEVAATGAAQLVAKTKVIPKTAKIGILSNNIPGVKAAGDTLESALKKHGYGVVSKIELNGLAANAQLPRESAAAADTLQAKGIDTVFDVQSFTPLSGFYEEVQKIGAKFKVYAIDGQANTCVATTPSRMPANAAGTTCITAWDSHGTASKDKIEPDNTLESTCRKEYDATTGKKSVPGNSNGIDLEVNGISYPADLSPNECTIASFLLPAIKKAGKNLTWDKVYANILATRGPAAYMSQGQAGFAKNKPYFANPVLHFEDFTVANGDTPKSANGLFNGCAVPKSCWIPRIVNGQEWFPVSTKANA